MNRWAIFVRPLRGLIISLPLYAIRSRKRRILVIVFNGNEVRQNNASQERYYEHEPSHTSHLLFASRRCGFFVHSDRWRDSVRVVRRHAGWGKGSVAISDGHRRHTRVLWRYFDH